MALYDLSKLLSENTYPGRGIVIGKSADGKSAMIAYFIMGLLKIPVCLSMVSGGRSGGGWRGQDSKASAGIQNSSEGCLFFSITQLASSNAQLKL